MSVAGPPEIIDLTTDDSDFVNRRKRRRRASVIDLDDWDLDYGGKGKGKARVVDAEDEDIIILSSSPPPVASSSKPRSRNEQLALRLAEEDAAARSTAFVNPEDERLAQILAQEEERQYQKLLKDVEDKQEGIVFSVAVNAADDTLDDGSPAHPDDLERFRPWKQLFEASGVKVKKFHWFVNYELEKRYEQARDQLHAIMRQQPVELNLFHGTREANIDSILKGGFRIGGADIPVVNGAAFGYGIYLAADAMTSVTYAMDANRIFACRVLPGRITQQPIAAPPKSTQLGAERYESYGGNRIHVVRYASLVLPCYMIEFDNPRRQMFMPPGIIPRGVAGFAGRQIYAIAPPKPRASARRMAGLPQPKPKAPSTSRKRATKADSSPPKRKARKV
ncbi:hypothetical protein C8J56DRAFT_171385 [Mycena floridula]|nr:hypothetical protein C8J56DRAFT_171385 [Mycena floridula]